MREPLRAENAVRAFVAETQENIFGYAQVDAVNAQHEMLSLRTAAQHAFDFAGQRHYVSGLQVAAPAHLTSARQTDQQGIHDDQRATRARQDDVVASLSRVEANGRADDENAE